MMGAKRLLNRLRYNVLIATVASRTTRPLERCLTFLARQLRTRIWANGARVTYDGLELVFPRNAGVVTASLIYWQGFEGYEPHVWRVLRNLLPRAHHFVDAGSNVGLYAVLARRLHPDVVVDAFEPVPAIYDQNLRFHAANGQPADHVWNLALSDRVGEAELVLPTNLDGPEEEATATLRSDGWQSRKPGRRISVQTMTLDAFLERHERPLPTVLKIDVEDFEAAVLRGARRTLAERRPAVVCEILPRPHGNRELVRVLEECGYVAFGIGRAGLCRFAAEDFAAPRKICDFLLVPADALPESRNYVSAETLVGELSWAR